MTDIERSNTEFVHNTDLNPADEYLSTLPRIRAVLRDSDLLKSFRGYDRIANFNQHIFRWTGTISLWLSSISLFGIATELFLAAVEFPVPRRVTILLEILVMSSILLAIAPRVARIRTRWLVARFMTEQIRQWHFQMLLDGDLVSKAYSAPATFESEREARWARFKVRVPNAEGAMSTFINAENLNLHHDVTSYPDFVAFKEALYAYIDLRFQKQLDYFMLKREEFAAKDEWSEAVARWTIFSALVAAALQLLIAILRRSHGSEMLKILSDSIFAAVIMLVILSAAVRVYRSALALSSQRERYETKWVRLVTLRVALDKASDPDQKLEIMKEVEKVEVEELREFLREMRRANYIL